MSLRIQCVDVDAHNPAVVGRFWADALGWRVTAEKETEWVLEPAAGSPEDGLAPDLLFIAVPESKALKNRLHLDLRPSDQAAEIAPLEGLGATRVDIGQGDRAWVVMADPEGNEFCVLRAFTPEELASF